MRRSRAATAESRDRVVTVAARLLRERGPEGVSVAEVMAAAATACEAAKARVREPAERNAEERILDALLPRPRAVRVWGEEPKATPEESGTREKFREMLRAGKLDEREVDVDLSGEDLRALAQTSPFNPGIRRAYVVTSSAQLGATRLYQAILNADRSPYRIFESYDEAVAWLHSEDGSETQ